MGWEIAWDVWERDGKVGHRGRAACVVAFCSKPFSVVGIS